MVDSLSLPFNVRDEPLGSIDPIGKRSNGQGRRHGGGEIPGPHQGERAFGLVTEELWPSEHARGHEYEFSLAGEPTLNLGTERRPVALRMLKCEQKSGGGGNRI